MISFPPLQFRCAHCGGLIKTAVAHEGTSAPCPICFEVTTAPRMVILPVMTALQPEPPAEERVTEEESLFDMPLDGSEMRIGELEALPRLFKPRRAG